MEWKLFSNAREARLSVDTDRIGLVMWVIAVLVIGFSLVVRINKEPAVLNIIVLGAFVAYFIGLVLLALGVLHVLRTRLRAMKAQQRTHLRYARPALFPLWYQIYSAPSAGSGRRAHRWASLRFDHGQACAWGIECLLVAVIMEAALMLAEQHPLWHHIGLLAVLAAVRTTLLAVREDVTAHGHSSAIE